LKHILAGLPHPLQQHHLESMPFNSTYFAPEIRIWQIQPPDMEQVNN
jgi:hypothetical protein